MIIFYFYYDYFLIIIGLLYTQSLFNVKKVGFEFF